MLFNASCCILSYFICNRFRDLLYSPISLSRARDCPILFRFLHIQSASDELMISSPGMTGFIEDINAIVSGCLLLTCAPVPNFSCILAYLTSTAATSAMTSWSFTSRRTSMAWQISAGTSGNCGLGIPGICLHFTLAANSATNILLLAICSLENLVELFVC